MKFNHFCLIAGIFIIILAMTTFANAATYTFDCSSRFNCSIKSYCQGVSGAVPGLLVHHGTADSYTMGSQPIDYSFTSNYAGAHSCSATVTVTAMYSQGQTNENTTIYVNGVNLGTTSDNYCNGGDSENCTFCGRDTQILPSRSVTLNQTNTLRVYGHDSHAVVSVILTCNPSGDVTPVHECGTNHSPQISSIPNQTINYNSTSNLNLDLWNYISDSDDADNYLDLSVTQNGASVSCTISDDRYLVCSPNEDLGSTTINLAVVDNCDARVTRSFTVTTINNAPVVNISNLTRSCVNNLTQLINLRNYSYDEEVNTLTYAIVSQSNTDLINCSITDGQYVSCIVNTCSDSYSDINISVTDIFGVIRYDSFRLTLQNQAPTWTRSLLSQCINQPNNRIIDLNGYATDLEDGNNITYSILNQTNTVDITCSLDQNRYLSCTNLSNKKISNVITIIATDTKGAYSSSQVTISTNCFSNGDDNNIIIESDIKGVCLETCTSHSTQIKVSNYSGEKQCFNYELENSPESLSSSLMNESFCLNNKESTFMTLSVNTCGSDSTNYNVYLIEEDKNIRMTFDYRIGNCQNFDGFRMEEFDGKICAGEKRTIPVTIRNTSDSQKIIYLNADNSMVLPYFEKEKVTLESNEQKIINLVINARSMSQGKYKITLGGDAPNYHIEKRLDVEVVDCKGLNTAFIITNPDVCYNVQRGQLFQGSFKVKNVSDDCACPECSDKIESLNLFLGTPFYELSNSKPELKYLEEKIIDYQITIPESMTAGVNFITIEGTTLPQGIFDDDLGNVLGSKICINVAGQTNAGILLKTQTKDIDWCSSEIFELEIQNTGDLDEEFTLNATKLPNGIVVNFSETKIKVKKGETKIVYVSISTNPQAEIRDGQSVTINVLGRKNLSTEIYFNVKEKPSFNDLEIVSLTTMISAYRNTETTYTVMLKNNTERELRNLKITFESLPTNVLFEEKEIPLIAKGEVVKISGKLAVGDINGYFEPVIIVSGTNVINKKKLGLLINDYGETGGVFSGLFGLFNPQNGSSTGLFSIFSFENNNSFMSGVPYGLLLILLAVILILGLLSTRSTNNSKKEVWMEVSNYE
ncbi:MAG TPA: hypothetical protein PKK60_01550 [archaeon]|nr:hypothetical protein [archaeon]